MLFRIAIVSQRAIEVTRSYRWVPNADETWSRAVTYRLRETASFTASETTPVE